MKAGIVIETIKSVKNLGNVERELDSQYKFDDEVDVAHFTGLLQTCLVGLPEEQSLLLKPIIRELKLSQLL